MSQSRSGKGWLVNALANIAGHANDARPLFLLGTFVHARGREGPCQCGMNLATNASFTSTVPALLSGRSREAESQRPRWSATPMVSK